MNLRSLVKPRALFVFVAALTGCTAILGVPDLTFDPDSPQGRPDGASTSEGGSATDAPSSGSDGDPGGPCDTTKLNEDPNNCGRCGHGCAGGGCTEGVCQPITLADAVGVPQQIALDATYLYYAAYNDEAIRRVRKDGTAQPETLVTGWSAATGVALDGTSLFFSGSDGVQRCTVGSDPSTCGATKHLISEAYLASNMAIADGHIYVVANTEVHRILANDAGEYVIGSAASAWSVATNGQYVYWTGLSNGLDRALVDGGNPETAGPLWAELNDSYVTSDGDGFFWSYKEDGSDAGKVYGAKHADIASRTEYTAAGGHPVGVAADAQYVYWTDRGSLTGGPNSDAAGDGRLLACPRAGGCGTNGPLVLATGLRGGGTIVVDDQAVYFVENNNFRGAGRIRKVAKP